MNGHDTSVTLVTATLYGVGKLEEGFRTYFAMPDTTPSAIRLLDTATLKSAAVSRARVEGSAMYRNLPVKALTHRTRLLERAAMFRSIGRAFDERLVEQVAIALGAGEKKIEALAKVAPAPKVVERKNRRKELTAKRQELSMVDKLNSERKVIEMATKRIEQAAFTDVMVAKLFGEGCARTEIVKQYGLKASEMVWTWLAVNVAPKHNAVVTRQRTVAGRTIFCFRKPAEGETVGQKIDIKEKLAVEPKSETPAKGKGKDAPEAPAPEAPAQVDPKAAKKAAAKEKAARIKAERQRAQAEAQAPAEEAPAEGVEA